MSPHFLTLADSLSLPAEAATRRMAILGMSGSGKSNVAVVSAEQMFAAGIPFVVIDPKGDWFGIRSNKSGKGPGLSVPIFGGLHADVKIDPTPAAGRELAEVIVAQRLTSIVDISEFTDRQDMWGFLAAFGEVLLHKNRLPLHIFLEEADEYLPQRTSEKGNLPKCLGVWQRLVKRGRFRGIGSTQITQRSAALNKDTLYQAEALFAMRASGKGDRDAVKGWVEHHNAADEIVASLPTLDDGEGWFSSPAWLRITKRVRFNRRQTFDSGSTPVSFDGDKAKAATLADVDLSKLETAMATAIEKAKQDDPALLRTEIRRLNDQVKRINSDLDRERAKKPVGREKRVEVQALKDKDLDRLEKAVGRYEIVAEALARGHGELVAALVSARSAYLSAGGVHRGSGAPRSDAPQSPRPGGPDRDRPRRPDAPPRSGGPRPAPRAVGGSDAALSGVEQRILDALAELEQLGAQQPARELVAFMADYTNLRSKGFSNAIGALRTSSLIGYPTSGTITLTDAGRAAAQYRDAPRSSREVQDRICSLLGGASARILQPVIDAYPKAMDRDVVPAAAGYGNTRSKGFANATGRLRSLGFIDYPDRGTIRAASVLFLEGA